MVEVLEQQRRGPEGGGDRGGEGGCKPAECPVAPRLFSRHCGAEILDFGEDSGRQGDGGDCREGKLEGGGEEGMRVDDEDQQGRRSEKGGNRFAPVAAQGDNGSAAHDQGAEHRGVHASEQGVGEQNRQACRQREFSGVGMEDEPFRPAQQPVADKEEHGGNDGEMGT